MAASATTRQRRDSYSVHISNRALLPTRQCVCFVSSAQPSLVRRYSVPGTRSDKGKLRAAGSKKKDTVRISEKMEWSRVITHSEAIRLITAYDSKIADALAAYKTTSPIPVAGAGVNNDSTYVQLLMPPTWDSSRIPVVQKMALGRHMPSSVMHRLDMEFHADIRRRRRQHGLRIRVLAALGVLQHLIRTNEDQRDTSGRVYIYLEELNRLYIDCFRASSPSPLVLRSANSVTLDMDGMAATNPTFVVVTHDRAGSQLEKVSIHYRGDDSVSFMLDRGIYAKEPRRISRDGGGASSAAESIDPRRPCWIDYLVDDLSEADGHALFQLVSRSKVPQGAVPLYRSAIEEALVFAFNRKGYAVDPLEGLRTCTYFIRRIDVVSQKEQLRVFWKHASKWCIDNIVEPAADASTLAELRFKRWNNVASELIEVHSRAGELQAAWDVVSEWHRIWTRVIQALCPVRRRAFVEGNDPYTYPYWRPKAPGRYRLHELTLSSRAITCMMVELSKARRLDSAAELLGLATSEAGVSIVPSMFTIMLRGVAEAVAVSAGTDSDQDLDNVFDQREQSFVQPSFNWTNVHAPALYKGTQEQMPPADGRDRAQMLVMAVLRGVSRWAVTPDAYTLEALVQYACAVDNMQLLKTVVQLFAATWGIEPTERSWSELMARELHASARGWIRSAVLQRTDAEASS
ncbi:hypothetical protein EV175_001687 [Coemansia sp. RSA 1933]|nr:hypothetical protein EV175_001687 [Coemansia sp. RSA 1933]